jgi:hypothetical protein
MILRTLKAVWSRWKVIAHKIGDFQARLLLSLFYFAILGPFALGARIFSDPLRLGLKSPTAWLPRPSANDDELILARRQY